MTIDKICANLQTMLDDKACHDEMTAGQVVAVEEAMQALCRTAEDDKAREEGRLVVLPCKVGDTVYKPGWSCRNGVTWNCESAQGCMTAQECLKCNRKCDLHRDVNEEVITSAIWLISEFCYGNFGKTVFLTRAEAEAASGKQKGADQ